MTNYERIKQMSVDEIADFIFGIFEFADDFPERYVDFETIKQWLESEAEEC